MTPNQYHLIHLFNHYKSSREIAVHLSKLVLQVEIKTKYDESYRIIVHDLIH